MAVIDIIVHLFAEQNLKYAKQFTAQVSSLLSNPTEECRVNVKVCYAYDDQEAFRTIGMLCAAICRLGSRLALYGEGMPRTHLFRRASGRNYCALSSKADIVWFCDADYLFGEGCLDSLASKRFDGLAYPSRVGHVSCDLSSIRSGIPASIDGEPRPSSVRFATGGLQIVNGDCARKYGYLNGTKWSRPLRRVPDRYPPDSSNAIYRRSFAHSDRLHLPNLYKIVPIQG